MTVSDSPQRTTPRSGGILLSARGTGAWLLSLRERQSWASGWAQQIEVEILFPVAQSGPPASENSTTPPTGAAATALRRRRGRVRRADLCIDQAGLNRALSQTLSRHSPRVPPFDRLYARIESGDVPTLILLFRVPAGGAASGPWTPPVAASPERQPRSLVADDAVLGYARIALRRPPAGYHDLVLGVSELLLFGPCTVPAPLLSHALLQRVAVALMAYRPAEALSVPLPTGPIAHGLQLGQTPGLSELRLDLLHDALLDTLPRHGYRVADPTTAPLCEITAEPGRLLLRYAAESSRGMNFSDLDERPRSNPIIDGAATVLGAPLPEVLRIADYFAYTGDVAAALATYGMAAGSSALSTLARTRRLQFLCSAQPCHEEAAQLAQSLLADSETASLPQLCLAALTSAHGQHAEAAALYRCVADNTSLHVLVRALASYAAARQLSHENPQLAGDLAVQAEGLLTPLDLDDEARALLRSLAIDAQGRLRSPQAGALADAASADVTTAIGSTASGSTASQPERADSRQSGAISGTAAQRDRQLADLLHRLQNEDSAATLSLVEQALAGLTPAMVQADAGWLPVLLLASNLCVANGEIERARALLCQAGSQPDALHLRVRLDWPELLAAEPGSAADLLPVLRSLQQTKQATPEELRGLARLLTLRGDYADALTAQQQAGGDPDELLAVLEASGRFVDLLRALRIHAELRPESASLLFQQAGNVAEQQLGDRAEAATLWQHAAELATAAGNETSTDVAEATAILWFHAGRLWHECGELDRAYAALGQAVARGGRDLPRAQLLLADLAYALQDPEAATFYYRQALHAGQVPPAMRASVYLRLAELSRQRDDGYSEEQALASAVEAGGGAQAWPLLADLFARRGDLSRRAMAQVAWADHLPTDQQAAVLLEAAAHAPDLLLARIDDQLVALQADDELVRDRVLARTEERVEPHSRLRALRHDVARSSSSRKRKRARALVELALQVSDYDAAVYGWQAILDAIEDDAAAAGVVAGNGGSLTGSSDDAITAPRALLPESGIQAFLGFWRTLQRAGHRLNVASADLAHLRERVVELGNLSEQLYRTDRSLALQGPDAAAQGAVRALRWQAATLAELVGEPLTAAHRYLQLCASSSPDRKALSGFRSLCRGLVNSGQASQLLGLIETELDRPNLSPAALSLLRVAQAEVQLFLGRGADAEGLLASALQGLPTCGPAHAMLGMLLATESDSETSQRGLRHLLYAAYAPDVAAPEAGECALLAADLLAAAGITDAIDLSLLQGEEFVEKSFSDRATAGTFVAIPADFLTTPSMDEAVPVQVVDPVSDPLSARAAAVPEGQGAVLPTSLGPEELLLHAASLLPGDPRPLEGLLGLSWTRGHDSMALECCERLLALPVVENDPAERARLRLEQGHVYLRLGQPHAAETALRRALSDAPSSLPILRALRELLLAPHRDAEADAPGAVSAKHAQEALGIIERELALLPSAQTVEERQALAALYCMRGDVHRQLADDTAARESWRRAGQLGLWRGFHRLGESLAQSEEWLAAADAAGRAALLLSTDADAAQRGELLLQAAEWALHADDELRAREHLLQASAIPGDCATEAEARLLTLDGGQDPERRRRALERRLQHVPSGVDRVELLRRLLLLCCEQFDRDAMVSHAVALLREAPGDALALCALAEDAIERGQLDIAADKLGQIESLPQGYPRAARLLAWLADQHERRGHAAQANTTYEQLLALGERTEDLSAIEDALEGLSRLSEERGDPATALRLLRRRLPYLPTDAIAARTALRLRLCDLALAQADLLEARSQLQAILSEQPQQRSALVKLLDVYRRGDGRPADVAESLLLLERLLDLAMTPGERAEWLYARGELHERHRRDLVHARADYERAIAQWPGHARALRRLVYFAARRADGDEAARHVASLQRSGALLGDVQCVAALVLALPTETATAEIRSARRELARSFLHSVDVQDLADGLRLLGCDALRQPKLAQRLHDLQLLDGPVALALQAVGGDVESLAGALRERLWQPAPSEAADHALRQLQPSVLASLAALTTRANRSAMGAQLLYLSTLSFLAAADSAAKPGDIEQRLTELGALPIPEAVLETALAQRCPLPIELAPFQTALSLLGRYVLGLQGSPLRVSHEWGELLSEQARSLGMPSIEVALLDDGELASDEQPALCDPSRPPRLRLLRRLTTSGSEPQARFAALRALYLLRSGVSLVLQSSIGSTRIAGLLRAAIALWLSNTNGAPSIEDLTAEEAEWLPTLRALALHPDHSSGLVFEARGEAEALLTCFSALDRDASLLHSLWPRLRARLDLEASLRALAQLGDPRAALVAMQPPLADLSARIHALSSGPLADLWQILDAVYLHL